jgi:hypothetical protein
LARWIGTLLINLATVLLVSPVIASFLSLMLVKLDAIGQGRHRKDLQESRMELRGDKGGFDRRGPSGSPEIEVPEMPSMAEKDAMNRRGDGINAFRNPLETTVSSMSVLPAYSARASSSCGSGEAGVASEHEPCSKAAEGGVKPEREASTRSSSSAGNSKGIQQPADKPSEGVVLDGIVEQTDEDSPRGSSDDGYGPMPARRTAVRNAEQVDATDPAIQKVELTRAMSRQILNVTAELSATKQQLELQRQQQLIKEQQDLAKHEELKREMEKLKYQISNRC